MPMKKLVFCLALVCTVAAHAAVQRADERAYNSLVNGFTFSKGQRARDLKLLAALMLTGLEEEAMRIKREVPNFCSEKEMLGLKHLGDLAYSIFSRYKNVPADVMRAQNYALQSFRQNSEGFGFIEALPESTGSTTQCTGQFRTSMANLPSCRPKSKDGSPSRLNGHQKKMQSWKRPTGKKSLTFSAFGV